MTLTGDPHALFHQGLPLWLCPSHPEPSPVLPTCFQKFYQGPVFLASFLLTVRRSCVGSSPPENVSPHTFCLFCLSSHYDMADFPRAHFCVDKLRFQHPPCSEFILGRLYLLPPPSLRHCIVTSPGCPPTWGGGWIEGHCLRLKCSFGSLSMPPGTHSSSA